MSLWDKAGVTVLAYTEESEAQRHQKTLPQALGVVGSEKGRKEKDPQPGYL